MNNNIIVLYIGSDPHVEDQLKGLSLRSKWEIQQLPALQSHSDLASVNADLCLFDLDHKDEKEADQIVEMLAANGLYVIFLTATDNEELYLRFSKKVPAGFLVKPLARLPLRSLIETSVFYMNSEHRTQVIWQSWKEEEELQESFYIKNNHKLIKVRQFDILAVMADDNYCVIITPQRRHAVKISLRRMKQKLSTLLFKQIHRNYIIQLPKVESVDLSTGE
ncbi:MAG: LytTR family transcriptional regulator DNA-binding domain-containing protein, partial [Sinomicrobium sp.]|nr:LytTR family transcriptional regulator DNA-binding domain-containing protein [Sinomicrobium sp.]